jgi:L-xylulokinase
MDVRAARFDSKILDALGIPEVYEKLAPLKFSTDTCGKLTARAAALTGLKPGTPAAGGMFDIDACAIAMAITDPKQLAVITGTWSINEFISPKPMLHTAVAMNSLYAIPGFFLLEECSATGAGNIEWAMENCMGGGHVSYDRIGDMVASVDPAQCNVYYLPFLYGSNTHALAKAGFVGLTAFHSAADMLRAVFEGVAYSHKTHVERLLSVRPAPAAIRMAGGAVNSAIWTQMFADVLGFPIETVAGVTELGALGCAMAASVAAGVYRDYGEATQSMVRVNPAVEPDMARRRIYSEKYETYTAVSRALDTVWDRFDV